MKVMLTSDLHYGCAPNSHNKLSKFVRKMKKAIEDEDVKVLIIAGDSTSFRQRQFKRLIELVSEYITIPVAIVRGNHDFWDGEDPKDKNAGRRPVNELNHLHRQWFKTHAFHHLEDGPLIIEDVIICGFDGWYASANPPTNDKYWICEYHEGCPTMTYLSHKAWKDFDKCLELDLSQYRKSIIVTHFNPYPYGKGYNPSADALSMSANPRFLEEIKDKFDVLCCGHTHQWKDYTDNTKGRNFKIYNSGSDYNQPRFIVFDV